MGVRMPPWIKLAEILAPTVLNFITDRKNTREIQDRKSQEIFNDLYKRLDLAHQNDQELKKAILMVEGKIKKLVQMFWAMAFVIVILLIIILLKST
jgi:hypothetical protein